MDRTLLIGLAILYFAGCASAEDPKAPFPVPIYDAPRMVFFEPGSDQPRPQSKEIIVLAFQIANHYEAKVEVVTGYCDAAEIAAGACPALATRRAEAVEAELVKLGMRNDMIEIHTSTDPFDPADQRLNRRVVIEPN